MYIIPIKKSFIVSVSQRIQLGKKRTAKKLLILNNRASCKHFIEHNIHTISYQHINECVTFILKKSGMFVNQQINHPYSTRNKDNLKTNSSRFTFIQKNINTF